MAQWFDELQPRHIEFIQKQRLFFVATGCHDGRINCSPKGLDSLRIVNRQQILWLNYTGSGNETAAHLLEDGRITLMFCAFEGPPLILRVYGNGTVIHTRDSGWSELLNRFSQPRGARQLIQVTIESVQTSCGYAVPLMEYVNDREILTQWTSKKDQLEIEQYWLEKNQCSIDGKKTGIVE